jgi:predicted dithiol-disulfide oxidoreductase (DUF899 family)
MPDSSLLMPGADEGYRRSRESLRAAEIDLRDRIEAVAAMRRDLPRGPVVSDYAFAEDGFNGIAPHLTQQVKFAVASRATNERLRAWPAHRGWHRLRLLSVDASLQGR